MKYIFALALLFSLTLNAQDSIQETHSRFLQKTSFGKPFISEIHSTINKVEFGYNKFYSEFDLLEEKSSFDRPMVELHVGFEAPLFVYKKQFWGLAATLPLSIHVLEDMWGPETAPVINTDYRFGGPKFIVFKSFNKTGFIRNASLSWLTIFHECTHLGDEIVIYRMDQDFPITRINVSYEFTEFQITLNEPENHSYNNHSFRLGFLYRISNRGLGWYSVRKDIEVSQDLEILASNYRSEYFLAYQFQRTQGFLASKRCVNIVSFEIRNRLRYGYPIFRQENGIWETKTIKEKMEFCYNLYLGYKFYPLSADKHSLGLFFHAYRGLNPYGQLRNYPSYPFFGLSLIYEP